jgi:hypothetical protein
MYGRRCNLFDREQPAQARDNWTRAVDAVLGEQDSFQISLNTFRGHQNGFVFGTNAAGIQYDDAAKSGAKASRTPCWERKLEVKTRRAETFGWTAEFLYSAAGRSATVRRPEVWGRSTFMRNIQRNAGERTYRRRFPRQ